MEEGIFTIWTVVHFLSGFVIAAMLSTRYLRVMKFAGIFAFPFIFFNYYPLKIVAMVIMFLSLMAWVIGHFSEKVGKFKHFNKIIFAVFLLFLWEEFEFLTSPITSFGIESPLNRVADIAVGFVSFILFYILFNKIHKQGSKHKKHHNNP